MMKTLRRLPGIWVSREMLRRRCRRTIADILFGRNPGRRKVREGARSLYGFHPAVRQHRKGWAREQLGALA